MLKNTGTLPANYKSLLLLNYSAGNLIFLVVGVANPALPSTQNNGGQWASGIATKLNNGIKVHSNRIVLKIIFVQYKTHNMAKTVKK